MFKMSSFNPEALPEPEKENSGDEALVHPGLVEEDFELAEGLEDIPA